ncbi:MAG TPA: hypothetical protein VNP73_09345, partial [Actinomycetota bacterium]|nr:hypothetical protein [Actinomycetota bacterium]
RSAGKAVDGSLTQKLSPDALALFTELGVEDVIGGRIGGMGGLDSEAEADEIFRRLKLFSLDRKIKSQRTILQELNPLDDADKHDALFTELVGLEAQRRDLLRTIQGAA